jgi:hypothetical protein
MIIVFNRMTGQAKGPDPPPLLAGAPRIWADLVKLDPNLASDRGSNRHRSSAKSCLEITELLPMERQASKDGRILNNDSGALTTMISAAVQRISLY